MKAVLVVLWAFILMAQGTLAMVPCEKRTDVGNNACSLKGSLRVKSASGDAEVTSKNCDVFYNKSEFKSQPTATLSDANPVEKYTLVMVDPDAPHDSKGQYFLHWIVADIPGDDFQKGDLTKSNTIKQYVGPTPPDNTGDHRYMFLVYRQPQPPGTQVTPSVSQRASFDLEHWLKQLKLCGPESGLQFRTNFSGNNNS